MKFLFILLLPIFSFSQVLPMKDGKVVYEQTDSMPGLSKSDLFNKAKMWLVNSFPSREKNIIALNEDSGYILSYGTTPFNFIVGNYNMSVSGFSYYKVEVYCKPGKIRIRFFDITAKTGYGHAEPIEEWKGKGQSFNVGRKEQIEKVRISVNDLMTINMANFKNTLEQKSESSF